MDMYYAIKHVTGDTETFEIRQYDHWAALQNGIEHPHDLMMSADSLNQLHSMVEAINLTGVDWSRVEHRNLQKAKDWIKKNGQTETPTGCEFKAGDIVTFINDYGAIQPGKLVIGFDITPENNLLKYGAFIHLVMDAYWFPHKPGQLVKESGRDITPEFEWIYKGKTERTAQFARKLIIKYVREFHAETPNPKRLATLKRLIKAW